ncbi:peptide chain release factor N(5)-glutamine methyltransferase [Tessaracoccus antarcticus]|uniref:Peptide chain release factor N(5)-glutamine methyltransferase n=1 Tax=Tessaracoccus antarcticus TaxID=2479848 RepID=A0A3M0GNI4_9ACTN|nr:peptide chain release factor N(5)-glutamine methyltransferase [Tessaracoccus antarcticus]RMB58846.1 peptide chain release factor N(5)-glutamine methyltransferase [Tessaracoccus antarcticus]
MRAHDAMARAAARLQSAGLPSPVPDARVMLTHLVGATHGLLLAPDLTAEQGEAFEAMVERRAAGEPVQHITGVAPFRYEELRVGPGVFIPRPETEHLVDLALQVLAGRPPGQRRVVELCAGSGAITLSLAREIGGVELHAVELSEAAWPYLQENLRGVDVELVLGDMRDAFRALDGTVDLVVANPPYVPETDRLLLPGDVVGGDPDMALFSGADGLDALHVVRDVARRLLRPGGSVVAEHDEKQSVAVTALFGAPDFDHTVDLPDLTGRPRYVSAQRTRGVQGSDMAGLTP